MWLLMTMKGYNRTHLGIAGYGSSLAPCFSNLRTSLASVLYEVEPKSCRLQGPTGNQRTAHLYALYCHVALNCLTRLHWSGVARPYAYLRARPLHSCCPQTCMMKYLHGLFTWCPTMYIKKKKIQLSPIWTLLRHCRQCWIYVGSAQRQSDIWYTA